MPEIDHIEAQKRFKHLPTPVQDAMTAPETANSVGEIAKRHALDDRATGILADEIGWIMLGAKHLQEISLSLERKLGIDTNRANAIAQDTEREIFAPIQELIRHIYATFNQVDTHQSSLQRSRESQPPNAARANQAERPISSNLIRKQMEKRRFDEQKKEHPEAQKPKPYWPDPYREPLDGK